MAQSKATARKPVVKKVRKVKKVQAENPEPETPVEELATPSDVIETPGGTRKRRVVNAESVDTALEDLVKYIADEIDRQRELKEGNGGRAVAGGNIKFLRSALKQTKQVQGDVRRVSRKKRTTRTGNKNSGFMKEVPISNEMAKFIGEKAGVSMSRVDVTKRLHAYIVEKNLQNPENRREIRPDRPLAKLLGYNAKDHGPLYYYMMQKLIQSHFTSETPSA